MKKLIEIWKISDPEERLKLYDFWARTVNRIAKCAMSDFCKRRGCHNCSLNYAECLINNIQNRNSLEYAASIHAHCLRRAANFELGCNPNSCPYSITLSPGIDACIYRVLVEYEPIEAIRILREARRILKDKYEIFLTLPESDVRPFPYRRQS